MAESEKTTGFSSFPQGKPRHHWLGVILTLVFIVILGGGAVYLVKRAQKSPAAGAAAGGPPGGFFGRSAGSAGPSITVGEATAKEGDLPILIDALGTVTPLRTVSLVPQVSGILLATPFTEGQIVKKGQVLVRIDPRSYQQALTQAQGDLVRDQAQLAAAQVTWRRYRLLLDQDSIARQAFDTQDAQVKQLQGTVETDRAAVKRAQINLDYTTIVAPFTGLIGMRSVDPGNYVSTTTTSMTSSGTSTTSSGIATITQMQPINAIFTVPQERIPDIQAAARAGSVLPVTALDQARTRQLASGRFLTLDNLVNVSTGTVRAKAQFDNAEGKLFPNQFVNIRLQLGTAHGVLIPVTAMRTGPDGDYVYVIDQDSIAHMRPVKRGLATDEQIMVVQGLKAGEQVVSEGGDRVKDGSPVRRADAAGPGGTASGAQHAGSGAVGASAAHPGWANLPPQVRAKLQGMTPEQRRSYLQQLRAQHATAPGASESALASVPRGAASK
ncbi:MAG: efflux RND transporter periplasmic adaptor subunit [Burkholderiaceae bacterium]|jgi:multidrug efflux system membrane fusion protein|nr:efflux RND transporter periplasmic adaptor subunit [Burkholderiaceae bacterium]